MNQDVKKYLITAAIVIASIAVYDKVIDPMLSKALNR